MLFALGMKVMTWLGFGSAVARRFAWAPVVAALLLLFAAGYFTVSVWFDDTIEEAEDRGAAGAIIRGQDQTLGQLGDANNAEESLNSGGERNADRYAGCLRDAREPAQCERYNPEPQQ